MAGPSLVLLGIALAGLSVASAFNLDPTPVLLLPPNVSGSFGHQVLQLNGSRILVGAPSPPSEAAGCLYECRVDEGECRELPLAGNGSVAHMGMALARTSTGAIACGPGLSRTCDRNVYVSGLCYELGPRLSPPRARAPGYQGCLLGAVDLAFLFDGSNSMTPAQFDAIRDFMVDVMEKLRNSSIHFAAVQFSDRTRTEFTLRDYAARPEPRELLRHVRQLRSLTDTFSAIAYVAENIFTPESGSRPGAKRVMIIITDGDATDTGDVSAAEKSGILRYIIGVGNNFNSPDTSLYLSQFASQPSSEFVKVLDSFEKLKGLFSELQAKIYDIEDTSSHNRFHLELSSSGFSVAVAQGRVVTGAVGADNWAGGLLELGGDDGSGGGDVFVPNPALADGVTGSYLGYAVAALARPGLSLLAAGAPRHGHVGRVLLFEAPGWRLRQQLPGQQLGSYFGASLCALDLEGDGAADLLLVGAQLHFDGRRGGRVHLFRWRREALAEAGELLGAPGHPLGRFGAALAALGDLDGDGWAEAAVGAPLEDAEAGAVYVYRGRPGGLEPRYSQRLSGARMGPGLQHLGQALDGGLDATGDDLGDVAVGARGAVVLLRSRPVLWVTPQVTFAPERLPAEPWGCDDPAQDANATEAEGAASGPGRPGVQLQLCFGARLAPAPRAPPSGAAVAFALRLDANRAQSRGLFAGGRRLLRGRLRLEPRPGAPPACLRQRLLLQPCLEDTVTPLRVAVTFELEPEPDGPVLPPEGGSAWSEVPFAPTCGATNSCRCDLALRPLPPAAPELLLAPGTELGLRLALRNGAQAARRPALRLPLPPGLALRRPRLLQGSSATAISCRELEETGTEPRTLWCNVSHPVLHAGREIHIELLFDVLQNSSWDEVLQLTATASSDNEPDSSLADNAASWRVPVRYPADVVATWQDDSTLYLNFSSRRPENKSLLHHYQLEQLAPGPPGTPRPAVTAFVLVPRELPAGLAWARLHVTAEPGATCHLDSGDADDTMAAWLKEACATPQVTTYRCHLGPLVTAAAVRVTGVVQPPPHIEASARPRLCSGLHFTIDTRRFASRGAAAFTRAQVATEVELLRHFDPRWVYVGSGLGGLGLLLLIVFGLAKCGFFKRDYRERLDQDAAGAGTGDDGDDDNGDDDNGDDGDTGGDDGDTGEAPAGDTDGDLGRGGQEPLQGGEGAP
ncbi:integrin alpha-L [Apteryx mantelli]|uniref:Integrin alpha-L n=1 Tax=Apteryx mantelli TaxID=2696672 RepID=A0ABM4G6N6_9AVES